MVEVKSAPGNHIYFLIFAFFFFVSLIPRLIKDAPECNESLDNMFLFLSCKSTERIEMSITRHHRSLIINYINFMEFKFIQKQIIYKIILFFITITLIDVNSSAWIDISYRSSLVLLFYCALKIHMKLWIFLYERAYQVFLTCHYRIDRDEKNLYIYIYITKYRCHIPIVFVVVWQRCKYSSSTKCCFICVKNKLNSPHQNPSLSFRKQDHMYSEIYYIYMHLQYLIFYKSRQYLRFSFYFICCF